MLSQTLSAAAVAVLIACAIAVAPASAGSYERGIEVQTSTVLSTYTDCQSIDAVNVGFIVENGYDEGFSLVDCDDAASCGCAQFVECSEVGGCSRLFTCSSEDGSCYNYDNLCSYDTVLDASTDIDVDCDRNQDLTAFDAAELDLFAERFIDALYEDCGFETTCGVAGNTGSDLTVVDADTFNVQTTSQVGLLAASGHGGGEGEREREGETEREREREREREGGKVWVVI